jgi:hypothetical protein
MMPAWMDITLVLAAVLVAAGYLVRRKIRSVRRLTRDWTTGRVEACDSCPVIKIREVQERRMKAEGQEANKM